MRTIIAIITLALGFAMLHISAIYTLNRRIAYLEKTCASEYYRGAFETAKAFADGTARILTNDTRTAFEKEVAP